MARKKISYKDIEHGKVYYWSRRVVKICKIWVPGGENSVGLTTPWSPSDFIVYRDLTTNTEHHCTARTFAQWMRNQSRKERATTRWYQVGPSGSSIGPLSSIILALFLVACGAIPSGQNLNNTTNQNNVTPVCGNGTIEGGEQCDDGEANSDTRPNSCRSNCRDPYCGDGIIDEAEECDGSNLAINSCLSRGFTKGTLGCSSSCSFDETDCSSCGDHIAEGTDSSSLGYETCDGSDLRGQTCVSIGQADGQLGCTDTCTWDITGCVGSSPICGNGQVEMGEQCDDGNTDACDGCSPTCIREGCGNGVVECGETCDDGNSSNFDSCPDGVNGTCETATCGDGHVWAGHEACDDGNTIDDATCYSDCLGFCGDGTIQTAKGETCDDGNNTDDPECYSDCQSSCGDGVFQPSKEACDYDQMGYLLVDPFTGEFEHNTQCTQICTVPTCGDGICTYIDDGLIENAYTCPQDCTGYVLAGTDCGGGHWCPNEYSSHPSVNGHLAGICCPGNECVIHDRDEWNLQHQQMLGIENCGGCGVDCASDQLCILNNGCCSWFGGTWVCS